MSPLEEARGCGGEEGDRAHGFRRCPLPLPLPPPPTPAYSRARTHTGAALRTPRTKVHSQHGPPRGVRLECDRVHVRPHCHWRVAVPVQSARCTGDHRPLSSTLPSPRSPRRHTRRRGSHAIAFTPPLASLPPHPRRHLPGYFTSADTTITTGLPSPSPGPPRSTPFPFADAGGACTVLLGMPALVHLLRPPPPTSLNTNPNDRTPTPPLCSPPPPPTRACDCLRADFHAPPPFRPFPSRSLTLAHYPLLLRSLLSPYPASFLFPGPLPPPLPPPCTSQPSPLSPSLVDVQRGRTLATVDVCC